MPELFQGGAVFSPCRRWRYRLDRKIGPDTAPTMIWIMLNPSVADEVRPDPTITRVIGFARREGAGRLVVLNLFAFVSPYPTAMLDAAMLDAVGADNDNTIVSAVSTPGAVVVGGWGTHGLRPLRELIEKRAAKVRELVAVPMGDRKLLCLGTTKSGAPLHPLYLRADTPLRPL